jgi:hypothetical protein
MKFEKLLPHVAIYFALLIAALIFFSPVAFDGLSLTEHDNVQARGMSTQIYQYIEKENKHINWTDQAFIGMPTYLLYGNYTANKVFTTVSYVFLFGQPINAPHTMLFFMMILAYLGFLAMGTDKWISALGGLSFGFMANNMDLFQAGHSTKIHAMVYMIPILAATITAYRGKIILGSAIAAFCIAGQIGASHVQIAYYTFLMMGFLAAAFFVNDILNKKILSFIKASAALALAATFGILANLGQLWTTYEYSAETIRGGSELKQFVLEEDDVKALVAKGITVDDIKSLNSYGIVGKAIKTEKIFMDYMSASIGPEKANNLKKDILSLASTSKNKGLDKDYIFGWSYGIMETFTLVVPRFAGGGTGSNNNMKFFADDPEKSGIQLGNSHSAEAIKKLLAGASPEQAQNISNELFQMTAKYWGAQPFTSGTVYLGAIVFLLAILGLLMVKGPVKWGLMLVCGFFIMLAWGDNFKAFNYFMVDYFPLYNKFRAVTMSFAGVEAIAVILAVLGLAEFVKNNEKTLEDKPKGLVIERLFAALKIKSSRMTYLYTAFGISAAVVLYALMYSYTGDLVGAKDERLIQMTKQAPQWAEFFNAIKIDRAELLRSDALRSLLFITLGAAALWAFASNKLKQPLLLIGIITAISLIDVVMIDSYYINKGSFEKKSKINDAPPATAADQKILADKTPHYRVFDLLRGGSEAGTFQNSEGAYFHKILGGYHAAKPILAQELSEFYLRGREINPDHLHILGMLNVKYVLNNPEQPLDNPEALGNAWLVDAIEYVNTADEELEYLAKLVPRSSALTRKSNEAYLKGLQNTKTAGDYITLSAYHPEKLTYKSKTASERFAVFSEIYYPPHKGWNVYIDGKAVSSAFIKVNYLLRGMRIPAGEHTIEFKFEPRSHRLGQMCALFSSVLILAFLGFALWWVYRKSAKEDNAKITKA